MTGWVRRNDGLVRGNHGLVRGNHGLVRGNHGLGGLARCETVSWLDFVQSWLEAIRYKGVAIYLFFNTFSMSSLDPTLKKCPIYVILHMMHTCGMYKVELRTRH